MAGSWLAGVGVEVTSGTSTGRVGVSGAPGGDGDGVGEVDLSVLGLEGFFFGSAFMAPLLCLVFLPPRRARF